MVNSIKILLKLRKFCSNDMNYIQGDLFKVEKQILSSSIAYCNNVHLHIFANLSLYSKIDMLGKDVIIFLLKPLFT